MCAPILAVSNGGNDGGKYILKKKFYGDQF